MADLPPSVPLYLRQQVADRCKFLGGLQGRDYRAPFQEDLGERRDLDNYENMYDLFHTPNGIRETQTSRLLTQPARVRALMSRVRDRVERARKVRITEQNPIDVSQIYKAIYAMNVSDVPFNDSDPGASTAYLESQIENRMTEAIVRNLDKEATFRSRYDLENPYTRPYLGDRPEIDSFRSSRAVGNPLQG